MASHLTPGKLRGLKSISNERGVVDQRGILRKAIAREMQVDDVPASTIERFKIAVTEALTRYASAILLDPEYGLPAAQSRNAAGLLLAYERSSYDAAPPNRLSVNRSLAGIPGNDDCGQLSSWFVFAALGFYPVNAANGVYVLGSPLVNRAIIHNPLTRTNFTIVAEDNSESNLYIQRAQLNSKELTCMGICFSPVRYSLTRWDLRNALRSPHVKHLRNALCRWGQR